MKKRLLSVVCALCLLLALLPTGALAAGFAAPTLSIDAAYNNETKQVTVSVKIGAYTDLGALDFHVKYDKTKLQVNGTPAKKGLLVSNSTVSNNSSLEQATIGVAWVDESGSTTTEITEILTVVFDVLEGKSGTVEFSFDSSKTNFTDKSGDNTADTPAAGSVLTKTVTISSAPVTEYSINVTGGKATVAGSEVSKAAAGTTVTLTADAPASGKEFDKWIVDGGTVALADASSATTTFAMPASAVSVKATYKDATHSHTFDQEIVKSEALKSAADCTHDEVYFKSCTCGAVSTNAADTFTRTGTALGHDYTERVMDSAHEKGTAADCRSHDTYWYDCSRCDKNAKDDSAAADKYYESTNAGPHAYDSTWGYKDTTGHAHKCQYCDAHDTVAAHNPGAAATETTPQTCTECGYVINPASGHTHSFGTDWKSDTDKHWHECSCGEKSEEAAHTAGDWIVDTAATATADGTKHKECTVCLRTLITETISATGYTVTFNAAGGTASETSMQTGADGKLSSLPTASRSGYTFDGWYTAETGGTKVTAATEFAADTIVYAHWTSTDSGYSSSGGGSVTYTVKVLDSKNGSVTADRKTASAGATVTLTVSPDKGYVLESVTVLDKNGKELKLTEKDGKYTFAMPAGIVTVEASFKADKAENPFTDVPGGSYYEDAVLWAVEKGITGGTTDTTFAPEGVCTRAQAVTFLWRAAGSPAAKSTTMPFTDVAKGSYYETAVLWAVENGITGGMTDTTFAPDATCTRAQIVTFLWRSQKSPAAGSENPFADVSADAYYANAVLWAVESGVTGGTSDTTFSPGADCTRAQIVTFIYRALAE